MIALLTDGPLKIRPNELVRWLNALDKAHVWSHTEVAADGDPDAVTDQTMALICTGPHGGLISLMDLGAPLDPTLVQEARQRSWWYEEGERAAGHHAHWVIASGTSEGWEAAALRAKASSLIASLLVEDNPSIVSVWNGVNGTLFTPASVLRDRGFVARNEVPLAFWTYSALHSLKDGDVSITKGGLAPFLGYELEVWNAPRPAELVNSQLNAVCNYLLARGPIIKDGETIGKDGDPETMLCTFGPSRTPRNAPTQALFLSFLDGPAKPKPSFLGRLFGRQ
ncbi:MAG: DUF4261 domain-containing protein [Caulobacter sp.]|nr:DUF4261 domain-containing protein [Caulobacter sp.]